MTTPKTNGTVQKLRDKLAEAQASEDKQREAYKKAERARKAVARELMAALAADLPDLSPAERRALGLPRGGAK